MTDINAIGQTQQAPIAGKGKSASDLETKDFMEIWLASMTNQIPGVESSFDSTQLLTMASTEAQHELTETMQALADTTAENASRTEALAMLDQRVGVYSDQARFDGEHGPGGKVYVPHGASSVAVNVYNAQGKLVDTLQYPARGTGWQDWAWSGDGASAGDYHFKAVATRNGEIADIALTTEQQVKRVFPDLDGETVMELSNGQRVKAQQVVYVG